MTMENLAKHKRVIKQLKYNNHGCDFKKSCNWILKVDEVGSPFVNTNYEIKTMKIQRIGHEN